MRRERGLRKRDVDGRDRGPILWPITCGQVGPGELDARSFACGGGPIRRGAVLDDVARALVDMHPRDDWITRLEASLPRQALATDLLLQAAPEQREVSNRIQASLAIDYGCPSSSAAPLPAPRLPSRLSGDPPKRGGGGGSVPLVAAALAAIAALLTGRRARARATA